MLSSAAHPSQRYVSLSFAVSSMALALPLSKLVAWYVPAQSKTQARTRPRYSGTIRKSDIAAAAVVVVVSNTASAAAGVVSEKEFWFSPPPLPSSTLLRSFFCVCLKQAFLLVF